MYDAFIAFGQTYGLWLTIALLFVCLIVDSMQRKRLTAEINRLRDENHQLKRTSMAGVKHE